MENNIDLNKTRRAEGEIYKLLDKNPLGAYNRSYDIVEDVTVMAGHDARNYRTKNNLPLLPGHEYDEQLSMFIGKYLSKYLDEDRKELLDKIDKKNLDPNIALKKFIQAMKEIELLEKDKESLEYLKKGLFYRCAINLLLYEFV